VADDGWKDLVIANGHVYPELEGANLGDTYMQPTVLFRGLGNGKFADVTTISGSAFQTPRPARGLAVGDLDGDGQPEIVLLNMNAVPSLLKNSLPGGHSLNVKLTGTQSNRSAIGARVTVSVGARKMIDEVMSGGSYYSQNSFTLHFGLGAATEAGRIEVRWPSGRIQQWKTVASGQTVNIVEGATALQSKPFGSGARRDAQAGR